MKGLYSLFLSVAEMFINVSFDRWGCFPAVLYQQAVTRSTKPDCH